MIVNAFVALLSSAEHSNRVVSLKFHPSDGNRILSAGWDGCIRLWDIEKECCIFEITDTVPRGDCVAFSGDKEYIVSASHRTFERIQLWGANDGTLVKETCPDYDGMAYATAFNHGNGKTGSFLVVGGVGGSEGQELRVYRQTDTDMELAAAVPLEGGCCSVVCAPNDTMVMGITMLGKLKVFDVMLDVFV
eukprot:GHVU01154373.1.p1 GENE.GHVU01154373.1~~GHVU01154373.1.p1  ORF type:complete len:191 (-),score=22.94 GHVU01154373.1:246-818(-)